MNRRKSDMVIDIGNTRMKVALFVGNELDGVLFFSNRAHKKVADLLEKTHPERGIVSNVSKLNKPVANLFRKNMDLVYFEQAIKTPVEISYKTPKTLGTDRIANAVGAHKLYPKNNVLIIDFGTCIKYDIVTKNGEFKGGSIAPGVQMRFKSMHKMTGKLPRIKTWLEEDENWPGTDTKSSMVSGVIQGIHSEILRYMDISAEHYNNLTVIATGGDFMFFDKAFKNIIFAHPYLTLQGLHEILIHNKG
ncbi:MAG: type III pantothenate kinase [Cryomorphaceae bacterium]|nr:type III pantothenate kinase [Flavobacteriales bacterium]